MKIADLTCRMVKIWDLPLYFDVINVSLNNTYPGAGRVTLTGDGSSWSHYWNAIGEDRTIEQFVLDTNVDYLVMKLGNGISSTLNERDDDDCVTAIQQAIARARRRGSIGKAEAREAWDDIAGSENVYNRWVYTSDFYGSTRIDDDDIKWPEPPENPDYKRLEYAVIKMREALTQLQEQADEKARTEG